MGTSTACESGIAGGASCLFGNVVHWSLVVLGNVIHWSLVVRLLGNVIHWSLVVRLLGNVVHRSFVVRFSLRPLQQVRLVCILTCAVC